MTVTINKTILNRLEESQELKGNNITVNTAVVYLLSLYHGISKGLFNSSFENIMEGFNFYQRDILDESQITWFVPLYQPVENTVVKKTTRVTDTRGWEWVPTWQALFTSVHIKRGSNVDELTRKMKTFFSQHPSIRVEDVMKATQAYIADFRMSNSDLKWFKSANNFIKDSNGNSMLLTWIESTKVQESTVIDAGAFAKRGLR